MKKHPVYRFRFLCPECFKNHIELGRIGTYCWVAYDYTTKEILIVGNQGHSNTILLTTKWKPVKEPKDFKKAMAWLETTKSIFEDELMKKLCPDTAYELFNDPIFHTKYKKDRDGVICYWIAEQIARMFNRKKKYLLKRGIKI